MYNIINNHQHGFRPAHSCQSQLILLTEDILRAMDAQKQVDLILLDFCKAFDKVPHQRLLTKLKYYGIQGNLLNWITKWMTKRQQRVILDNKVSDFLPVKSGIPQGTILGPLMFLLYINNIDQNISSTIRLFADDCIMYRIVNTSEEACNLQHDLNKIMNWCKTWQMQLNLNKCAILRCTRSSSPILFDYIIDGKVISSTDQHTYLGITLHKTMQWSHHIDIVCNKASKALNFIRRNLSKCSTEVKSTAYLTLVRPIMEYAACVWDPYQKYLTNNIEKIQRRAVRWVLSDYRQQSSVTDMLHQLQWPSLQQRRYTSRLSQFHKIVHHHTTAINIPLYFLPTSYPTRLLHMYRFIIPSISTTSYQQSFFPKTIKQWNSLTNDQINITSLKLLVDSLIDTTTV